MALVIQRKQKDRKPSFADSFKVGAGQSLGQLPAEIVGKGFGSLADYLVGSKLTGERGKEERTTQEAGHILTASEREALNLQKILAAKAAAGSLSPKAQDAPTNDSVESDGETPTDWSPERLAGILGGKNPEPMEPVTTGVPAQKSMTNTRTFTSNTEQAPKHAVDMTEAMFPGVRGAITTTANRESESANRTGNYATAGMDALRKSGGMADPTDYGAEWDAQNKDVDMTDIDNRNRRRAEVSVKLNKDKAYRDALAQSDARDILSGAEKTSSETTKKLADSAQSMMQSPKDIATTAMSQAGQSDRKEFEFANRPKGPGQPKLIPLNDYVVAIAEDDKVLNDKASSPEQKAMAQERKTRTMSQYSAALKDPRRQNEPASDRTGASDADYQRKVAENDRITKMKLEAQAELAAGEALVAEGNMQFKRSVEALKAVLNPMSGATEEEIKAARYNLSQGL